MSSDNFDLSDYPGATTAYELLHSSLMAQQARLDSQSSRGFQIIGMATAVVGIGLPFAFGNIPAEDSRAWLYTLLAGVPVAVYIWAFFIALPLFGNIIFHSIDEPTWLRTNIWQLTEQSAKTELLAHGESAHNQNESAIAARRALLRKLLVATIVVSVLVIAHAVGMVVLKIASV